MTAGSRKHLTGARLRSCPFQLLHTRFALKGHGFNRISLTLASGIIAFLFSAVLIFAQNPQPRQSSPHEQKTNDPEKDFASQCGIDFDKATLHIFINSFSKGLKEYSDDKNPPKPGPNEESEFIVRSDPSGKHYVRTFSPGDDFDHYQDDCFTESGKVQLLHYELRTAWGWGYEETRVFDLSGKILNKSSRFFDTRSEKTIQPPERAKEVPDALKPEVHSDFNDMPFTSYLNE
jgi:hypothetical protein